MLKETLSSEAKEKILIIWDAFIECIYHYIGKFHNCFEVRGVQGTKPRLDHHHGIEGELSASDKNRQFWVMWYVILVIKMFLLEYAYIYFCNSSIIY